jgi:hypothetical protein
MLPKTSYHIQATNEGVLFPAGGVCNELPLAELVMVKKIG